VDSANFSEMLPPARSAARLTKSNKD